MFHIDLIRIRSFIRRALPVILCLCILPLSAMANALLPSGDASTSQQGIAGGTNTFSADANPVILSTTADLTAFRDSLAAQDYAGKTVQLSANLAYGGSAGGTQLPFQGTFDGAGHTITNYNDASRGFWESIGAQGVVQNLHLNMNVKDIEAPIYGAIANTCQGKIYSCWISGLMQGGTSPVSVGIGGIVGQLQDDADHPSAQIQSCLMDASILPAEGDTVSLVTAYGAASTTDNQRIFGTLVTGELDGDTVYGISDKGATRAEGTPSFYDNTVTSASYEDQYSAAKTFDELTDMAFLSSVGFDTSLWLLRPGETPRLLIFISDEEEVEEGESESTGSSSQTISVQSVALNYRSIALNVGESFTLKTSVSPSNATNRRVTWASDNTAVAIVDSKGTVTAVKEGTANVTVTTKSRGRTATCVVTVSKSSDVSAISLNASSISTEVGNTETLTASATVTDPLSITLQWSSSDSSVVKVVVDDDPYVADLEALKEGAATITVSVNGTSFSASCKITVENYENPTPSSVTLNKSILTLTEGGSTAQLTATVSPSSADQTVSWSSSHPSIAAVSGGVVTPVAAGTTTITVITADGSQSASCVVTVQAAASATAEPQATESPTEEPQATESVEQAPSEETSGE